MAFQTTFYFSEPFHDDSNSRFSITFYVNIIFYFLLILKKNFIECILIDKM
jgi:hypothetical protein